jgi:cytochrome c oxidase subunit IV
MENEKNHITEYSTYVIVWAVLLLLTAVNIMIATASHGKWIAPIISLISIIQAGIALNWFMHLRWDNKLFRGLVIGVFLLYAVVLIITFLDYKFR